MQAQNPTITETQPDVRRGLIPFISKSEATQSAISLFPQTANIMTTQTLSLFIDIDEFIIYLTRMLANAPVTLELLALCAVSRLREIIAERPNMTTIVIGETETRSDFAPGNVSWSNMDVPYSLSPDTPGYDVAAAADEIIGLHLYTSRTTPARALLDPLMKHAYRDRVFTRVLALIENDIAFAPDRTLSLTIAVPRVAGNCINFAPAHASSVVRRVAMTDNVQLVHFLETMNVLGRTRETSARVEIMAYNDCALMTALLMIEKDRVLRGHASIDATFAVFISVPSKPLRITRNMDKPPFLESDDDHSDDEDIALMPYLVVSVQRLYALIIGPSAQWSGNQAKHSVASFLATWIYVNGTQHWSGLHACARANDAEIIQTFISQMIDVRGGGYTGPEIAFFESRGRDFCLVMNVKKLSELMQKLHVERIRYQFISSADLPSTDDEYNSVVMSNIAWFYEELLQLRLYDPLQPIIANVSPIPVQDPEMRIATVGRDTLAACISGKITVLDDVSIRIKPANDTARNRAVYVDVMNTHPYAGDVHPITVQRRVLMTTYALSQMLVPMPLLSSSFASAFMNSGSSGSSGSSVNRGADDVPVSRTYRADGIHGIHGMYADMGFRAETTHTGTHVIYKECVNSVDIPLTNEFVEDYQIIVLMPNSANTSASSSSFSPALSLEREPLFHGVTISRISEDVFFSIPDERTPLQNAIMSAPDRLALLAADKIIAMQTLPGRNWLAEYARIMIGATRDDISPCEYLCLLLAYGIDMFRSNGYEAQWDRTTANILGLVPRNFMTGAKMQVLIPQFLSPRLGADSSTDTVITPVYSMHAPHSAYELKSTRTEKTSLAESLSGDAMIIAYLHMQTKKALAHRVTGREVYWRGSRGATRAHMLMNALRQLDIAEGGATPAERELSKGIMSPVAEVVDYAVPFLRKDMTPLEWDDTGDQCACIWGRAMEYAWIGVLRYMIAYSVHLKKQARTITLMLSRPQVLAISAPDERTGNEKKRRVKFNVDDSAPERIPTFPADRAKVRMNVLTVRPHAGEYLGALRMSTWACAIMMFRGLDPRMIYGNEHTALRMMQTDEFDAEMQNLNTILPIMRGMEVSIGRHGIAVYMNEWTDGAAQHYAEYALNLATTKKLGTWTMLGSSTLVLSIKIMQEMRPIAFYNVHRS